MSAQPPLSRVQAWLGAIALLLAAAVVNPLTIGWLQAQGLWIILESRLMHSRDVELLLPLCLDGLALVLALPLLKRRSPKAMFRDSILFNVLLLAFGVGILLTTNVVRPGAFIPLRIIWIVGLIVLLTQILNLAVVRERPQSIRPIWKNVGLSLYSIFLTLFLLEIVFLFVWQPHRYNGSLSSRSWFLKHWEVNSEGFRDPEYDPAKFNGKRKVFVAGDSFAAGHGIADPADRISEQLQEHLPPTDHVFNVGIPGADLRASLEALEDFPYQPDLFIFNYYPNDMERDGETADRKMARFQSYADLTLPLRFMVRRSYLWNYLYWRFPHASETFNYVDYLDEAYRDPVALTVHRRRMDDLIAYARANGGKMAVAVWPLLENVELSKRWTGQVAEHFRSRGIPVIDIATFTEGRDPMDMVVNVSDSHPNEAMHHEVADSVASLLKRSGWY